MAVAIVLPSDWRPGSDAYVNAADDTIGAEPQDIGALEGLATAVAGSVGEALLETAAEWRALMRTATAKRALGHTGLFIAGEGDTAASIRAEMLCAKTFED